MSENIAIRSGARLPGVKDAINVMEIGNPGQVTQLIIHNGMLYVYDEDGGTLIQGGVVMTGGLVVGSKSWLHNISFSSTDIDTASWSTGTIYFGDGTTTAISAGNTGNIAATTYVYYDGTATLAKTTNPALITEDTILLATVQQGTTGETAKIAMTRMPGGTIAAEQIVAGFLSATRIAAGSISTEKISVGSKQFYQDIAWTATSATVATWAAGHLRWGDATETDISGGNTGTMGATTYIYYNGTSTLQTSTTYSTATGETKKLLAIVELGATGAKCVITLLNGVGTTIDGDRITTGKIQSTDGKTYFDLDGNTIILNDGTNDRIIIGYQSGGF